MTADEAFAEALRVARNGLECADAAPGHAAHPESQNTGWRSACDAIVRGIEAVRRASAMKTHAAGMRGPLASEDWGFLEGVLEDLAAGRPRSFADAERAGAAARRLKAKHQKYLDACARLTSLANERADAVATSLAKDAQERGATAVTVTAAEIRTALGDSYLGGPLL